jgi:hypothetical protein
MSRELSVRPLFSLVLCGLLASPGVTSAQAPAPRYKLTIVEGASTSKRVKKGRVSSQAVVKITDENDVPVPAIAITFTIPQGAGGAAFANGGLTSIVTTNEAGIASSGSFSASAGTSFSINATAAAPGGAVTTAVPVTTAAVAASAAGISTGLLVGIIVGVGAAAAAGIAVATKGGSSSSNPSSTGIPTTPAGTIGAPGSPTFGHP